MNKIKSIFTIGSLCLILSLLLSVIDFWCFYMPFYESEYKKNETTKATGMKESDLIKTTEVLFDYLKDNRDDLIIRVQVNGYAREVFDRRETLHMKDVKKLYLDAMKVRNILFLAGAALLAAGVLLDRRKVLLNLISGYELGVIIFIVFVSCLLFYALLDFNSFWLQFHEIFFDNDLYFLDPNTEILINMVPENFFFDLVMRIILSFISLVAVIYLAMKQLQRRYRNA